MPPVPTRPSPSASRRLAPDQRAAATAPPGPVLCVAPAGSGKTTTLVARVAWLVDGGADPGSVCIVAFNKRAAEELDGAPGRGAGAAGRGGGLRAGPDVPRPGAGDPPRCGRGRGAAGGPGRGAARAVPRHHPGRPRPAGPRVLAAQAGPAGHGGRGGPGPGARADRPRLRRLRGRRPGVGRRRLRRPARARARAPARRTRACSRGGGRAPRGCSWTRPRTSTGRSWSWRCCWPRPRTTSSWSATTTRRSTRWRLADVRRVLGLAASLPGPAAGGPGDQLPLPAAGRGPRGAARRAQPRAVREADPGRIEGRRSDHPGPRCRRRHRPRAAGDGLLAGGRHRPARSSPAPTASCWSRWSPRSISGIPFRAPDLPLAIEDPRLDGLLDRAEAEAGRPRPGARPGPLPALGRLRAALRAAEAVSPPDDADEVDRGRPRDGAPRLGRRPPVDRRSSGRPWRTGAPGSRSSVGTTRR